MTTRRTMKHLYWMCDRPGQIVAIMRPQMSGSAEGEEGPAAGMRLWCDSSDGDWVLYDTKREIARGNKFRDGTPTVYEAMELRKTGCVTE